MNYHHLKFICTELQLGSPVGVATSVYGCRGGSLMWRVNTNATSIAIKQLAPIIDITNERMTAKYELSETIACRFTQHGIQAVSAIMKYGKHLIIIEKTGYLVYPWVEAYTLGQNEISQKHALIISEIIAKLHSINMSVPEIKLPHVDIHTCDRIIEAFNKAAAFKYPFAKSLNDNRNLILSLNESYQAIVPLLLEDTVVTHGDLDQLNILWDQTDKPVLIDWESARKLNPTREIVRASLVWSGAGTENFSLPIYTNMLHVYIKSGGSLKTNHMKPAFYSSIGSMINWMLHNIELACNSDVQKEKEAAAEEINSIITEMMNFKALAADLLEISLKICR
jgi:thiamine kinase-like enzyme